MKFLFIIQIITDGRFRSPISLNDFISPEEIAEKRFVKIFYNPREDRFR
jgi:hypothetical protein